MKMEYVISSWDIPSLPIVGSNARFPVRRIFCVGRNYVEHQKEMGGDGREQPFFFTKSAHDLVPEGGAVHFPPMTNAPVMPTKPEAGVMATSPATAPEAMPSTEGLPLTSHSVNIHDRAATAVASWVTTIAMPARPSAATAEPALKPNQPTQSNAAPVTVSVKLCGGIGSLP